VASAKDHFPNPNFKGNYLPSPEREDSYKLQGRTQKKIKQLEIFPAQSTMSVPPVSFKIFIMV